jgi:hypothetical protein
MQSFSAQRSLFGKLSQNASASNLALYDSLANIEHRYLLQKYFANETSYSITTVGEQSLTTTGALAIGATSATLTAPWGYHTTSAQITFSSGEYRAVSFLAGSTAISWTAPLTAVATTAITVGGLQFYPLPPNYSKLKTVRITIGNLMWTLSEIRTREDWDKLNVFPYYADIPANYFIYPGGDRSGQIGIWPIPSTTGNVITFSYKFRVPDLSMTDYTGSAGVTATATNGSTVVTGSGTAFPVTTNALNESRWIQFAPTATASTSGDNQWYQIASINSATSITLYQPYQGTTVTASPSYTIGQMPLLAEDFQDILIFRVLQQYFSSIVDNPNKAKEFLLLYQQKLEMLQEYSGSNTCNVNLSPKGIRRNPNLYQMKIG